MRLTQLRGSDRVVVGVIALLFGLNGAQSLIDQDWIMGVASCAIAAAAIFALIRDHRRKQPSAPPLQ
jgi:hypothetical protein